MWPFKKKKAEEEKPDWRTEAIKEMKEFRAKGDKFRYLGVEMLVYAHVDIFNSPYFSTYRPCLKASYVNKLGEIKMINFDYDELDTLKKENL